MNESMNNSEKINNESPFEKLTELPSFEQRQEGAGTLTKEAVEQMPLEERFDISPKEYPIFSKQSGNRPDVATGKYVNRTLSINETLGEMVGATAATIATITGEKSGEPMDHVIYLDKSARPVSWLVDDFWEDFTDKPEPSKSFLAIDRRIWLTRMGFELEGNEYIKDENGDSHVASPRDVSEELFNKTISREMLARIRALYIPGGIDSEEPDKIFNTPTVLDGKNILIIDEVSRSGSTLHIAKLLLKGAIPDAKVSGRVFWHDHSTKTDSGETQMGSTPVWYPKDKNDWRGRGVKDINQAFYEQLYRDNPTPDNRARNYGSIVLGEPLIHPEDEPGQLSWHLRAEMRKMHEDYKKGRILPTMPNLRECPAKLISTMRGWGVEFTPEKRPHAYVSLIEKRNQPSK
ncbi:hypothetical protein IJJ36_03945 [Candidatus Saccharibacteria bacterium]|nr:hypothetical protein [Candidatus Saccharibacteria bacterium]MBQ6461549.1 hypothetical protein [Candidatus Saccharibacteria bacterium]